MDIYEFYNELFNEKPENHWIYLWEKDNNKKTTTWYKNTEELAGDTIDKAEIFFGTGSTEKKGGVGTRIKSKDIDGLGFFHLDIDIGKKNKKRIPDTLKEAIDIANTAFTPSVLVHSGHGIHAYYLFDEYLTSDLKEVEKLHARFQSFHEKQSGFAIDHTHDLARVLRCPFTMNKKSKPKKTYIIDSPFLRYSIKDIETAMSLTCRNASASVFSFPTERLEKEDEEKKEPTEEITRDILYDKTLSLKEIYVRIGSAAIVDPSRKLDGYTQGLMCDVFDDFLEVYNHNHIQGMAL